MYTFVVAAHRSIVSHVGQLLCWSAAGQTECNHLCMCVVLCGVYDDNCSVRTHYFVTETSALSDKIRKWQRLNSNGRKLEKLLEKDLVMRMGVFLQILSLLVLSRTLTFSYLAPNAWVSRCLIKWLVAKFSSTGNDLKLLQNPLRRACLLQWNWRLDTLQLENNIYKKWTAVL